MMDFDGEDDVSGDIFDQPTHPEEEIPGFLITSTTTTTTSHIDEVAPVIRAHEIKSVPLSAAAKDEEKVAEVHLGEEEGLGKA
jgi:hypothetical protein